MRRGLIKNLAKSEENAALFGKIEIPRCVVENIRNTTAPPSRSFAIRFAASGRLSASALPGLVMTDSVAWVERVEQHGYFHFAALQLANFAHFRFFRPTARHAYSACCPPVCRHRHHFFALPENSFCGVFFHSFASLR